MRIICKEVNWGLFVVSYRSFQAGYVLYRLLKQMMIRPVMVILRKLSNIQPKIKWKNEIREESSDVDLSKWSKHIPLEIIELILRRLPLNDYLRFGTVCSSWRLAVAKKLCTPALEPPLLMFGAHPYTLMDHCFLNLSSNKVFYKPNCTELHYRHCSGSFEGWLIIADSILWRPEAIVHFLASHKFDKIKNFFLNPVSGARIMLPSQTTLPFPMRSDTDFFRKTVVSEAPTSPNCIVAAICLRGNLAVCRPTDNSWTPYKNEEKLRFCDVVFHDGQLYAITADPEEFVTVFDLREFSQGCRSPNTEVLVMLHPRPFIHNTRSVEGHTQYLYGVAGFHLVKDRASNDLLMIIHFSDGAYDDDYFLKPICLNYTVPPRIKSFQVFKLDQSGPRWVQIYSLGDQIVFVSQASCMIVSAASIEKHEMDFKGNCIYFALDYTCTTTPQRRT